jgi:hypothetical protein
MSLLHSEDHLPSLSKGVEPLAKLRFANRWNASSVYDERRFIVQTLLASDVVKSPTIQDNQIKENLEMIRCLGSFNIYFDASSGAYLVVGEMVSLEYLTIEQANSVCLVLHAMLIEQQNRLAME